MVLRTCFLSLHNFWGQKYKINVFFLKNNGLGRMFYRIEVQAAIMLTCPCNEDPLTPHFYIGKTGVYRGIHYFLNFALKHRLWVLVRTASLRRF